jgi:hypothetical protein
MINKNPEIPNPEWFRLPGPSDIRYSRQTRSIECDLNDPTELCYIEYIVGAPEPLLIASKTGWQQLTGKTWARVFKDIELVQLEVPKRRFDTLGNSIVDKMRYRWFSKRTYNRITKEAMEDKHAGNSGKAPVSDM